MTGVSKFVPSITRADEITIRQLLSHTSGIQNYWPQDYVPSFMTQEIKADGILDRWARKPLDFEPIYKNLLFCSGIGTRENRHISNR